MSEIRINSKELIEALQGLIDVQMPEALHKAVENACLKVEADSKQNAPMGDGTLRASITHEVENTSEGAAGYVGSNLEYAPYAHQGTGQWAKDGHGREDVPWTYQDIHGEWHTTYGMKPTPFIQDAVDANRAQIQDYFKEALNDGLS